MRPLPEVEIIDMRQEFQETGQEQVISRKLAEEIRERLEKKEQVMVLLNRRGYSPVVLCRACGKNFAVQELCRFDDGTTSASARWNATIVDTSNDPGKVRALRQRVRLFCRDWIGEARGVAARHVSAGADRADWIATRCEGGKTSSMP